MMFDVNSAPVIVNLGKPASDKVIVICCNLMERITIWLPM